MKIVLHAFGNKLSGVMEVPEETGPRFTLAMHQPIQVFNDGPHKHDLMSTPINKLCHFEWTGKSYWQEGHEYDGARIYQLVKID